jgi:PAS domain S-box-containing protein
LLVWLVLAILIPMLLFTAGAIWRAQTARRDQQEAALVQQARDAAQSVDQTFQRLQDGLLALVVSGALRRGDLDTFAEEARLLSARSGSVITLMGRDGSVLLRVAGSATPVVTDANRQTTLMALRVGTPVITNLLTTGDPATREVAVAVPARQATDATSTRTTAPYAVVAEINSAALISPMELAVFRTTGLVITIRDRDGVIVARSLQAGLHIGEPARSDLAQAIAGRASGLLPDGTTAEGIPAILAFSIAPVSGYTVVAALRLDQFDAAIHRELIQTILIGSACLIIGLIAAAYFGRRLVVALRAVERGDAAPLAPSGLLEIDELAIRLRTASDARKATENTLRDSENQLRDLIGTLDLAAIVVREVDGTIRFWSLGCTRMYGWSREEAVGRSTHELLRTQHPEPLVWIESTLLRTGEWKGDLVHRRRDGSVIIVASHKALKRDPDGRPYMVMESLVDVTSLREVQDTLRELNHDLEKRVLLEVTAREAAQRRAEHADRLQALGRLAGGIAHDFNNVLQAVAGGAALIARQPHDVRAVVRLIGVIGDAATRGASITRRMLLLARRGVLKSEPVAAEALLTGMQEVFVHTLGAAIDVQVEVGPGLPLLRADKAQLETALVNLATNAHDAMPNGGTLRLAADLEVVGEAAAHPARLSAGTYVRLSVVDNGSGMTAATLACAGEPFFTTKDVGNGTGLGLSMVKGFAEQSGGGFAIDSTPDVGTKATMWLPRAVGDHLMRPAITMADDRRRTTGLILLVDDDVLVRDTLTDQLEELGHKVLAASCGTDALAILRARDAVDLMVTDLSMPGMDGLTLIKEAQGLRPSLPAILLTGYAGDVAALKREGISRDSYALLRKPVTGSTLNAQVVALLERS